MKSIPVQTEVVDMSTGKTIETKTTEFHIIPPKLEPGACTECGRIHEPTEPHDQTRLLYQYAFFSEHHRWPTWADACAHCSPEVQAHWKKILTELGKWSESNPVDTSPQED